MLSHSKGRNIKPLNVSSRLKRASFQETDRKAAPAGIVGLENAHSVSIKGFVSLGASWHFGSRVCPCRRNVHNAPPDSRGRVRLFPPRFQLSAVKTLRSKRAPVGFDPPCKPFSSYNRARRSVFGARSMPTTSSASRPRDRKAI